MEIIGVPPGHQASLARVPDRDVRQFYGILHRRHAQPWEVYVEGETEQRTYRLGDRFIKVAVVREGARKYRSFDIVEPNLLGRPLGEAAAAIDALLQSNGPVTAPSGVPLL